MASDDEYDDSQMEEFSEEDVSEGASDENIQGDGERANGTHRAAKRQKAEGYTLLFSGDGIDHAQEAEDSILALEVRDLLSDATLPPEQTAVLPDTIAHIETVLCALPRAEVDASPIKGLLKDFKVSLPVSGA